MGFFVPRQFPEIVQDMLAELISATPLNDVNYGSVLVTMLETAAQEDDEQYFQMLEIIRGYSLDSVFDTDLDKRAAEFSLERELASNASTTVTISDPTITKVQTGVFAGAPGSPAGSMAINGDTANGFPASGSIIIGRGTPNAETVPYASITQLTSNVVFNLGAALAFDHGTDETIILSQGGNRVIPKGTVIKAPASDIIDEVIFLTDDVATLLDGEAEITGVNVTATTSGSAGNVPIGAISTFDSPPFPNATVTNPQRVTNGIDRESDQELRDRIKDTIQSLSKGTPRSIITGVDGLVSTEDSKRVVSVSLRDATVPTDVVKLFIDDGGGFIPDYNPVGLEVIVDQATGGEQFLNSQNVPILKAFAETQASEPFNISGGETLIAEVNGRPEVITFEPTGIAAPGAATAQELVRMINSSGQLLESRVTPNGKFKVFARDNNQEELTVTGGTANSVLSFPTTDQFTTNLYLERNNTIRLLSKDGRTATLQSGVNAPYDFSADPKRHLSVVLDGKINNIISIWFNSSDFVPPNVVTVLDLIPLINAQVGGLYVDGSSNLSRLSMFSRLERSAESSIRILENFTNVFSEEAGVDVDRTTEFQTSGSDVTLFAADNDYVHLGHSDVPFNSVFVKLSTPASTSIPPTFE